MTSHEKKWRYEKSFEAIAKRFSNDVAISEWTGTKWDAITYETLFNRAQAFSQTLSQLAVQEGERIILSSRNRIGLVISLLGAWFSKATVVLIDPDLPDSVWKNQCDIADARIAVLENERCVDVNKNSKWQWVIEIQNSGHHTHEKKTNLSHSVLEDRNQDIAALIFTSGTTGDYRAVILKQAQFHYLSQFYENFLQPNSCALSVLPLFHVAGLFCGLLQPLLLGVKIVFFRQLSTMALQKAFLQFHPVIVFGVPRLLEVLYQKINCSVSEKNAISRFVFSFLLKASELLDQYCQIRIGKILFRDIHKKFGGHLERILCGSATLPSYLQRFFLSLGFDVLCAYGLTETSGPITLGVKKFRWKIGNVGPCLDKQNLKIDSTGEIIYSGKALMDGYFRNSDATQNIIKNSWLHTGDFGSLDRFGNLYVIGRLKELIVFPDGKKATPEQIERAYHHVKGMREAAVFSVDLENGVIAVLAFLPENKNDADTVKNNLLKTASKLKSPYRISSVIVVDQIPRSNTLKIKRHELLLHYQSQVKSSSDTHLFENDAKLQTLIACIQQGLPNYSDKITANTTFVELNIDSLRAAQLAHLMSEKLKITVNSTVFWFTRSILELHLYLKGEHKTVPAHSKKQYEKIAIIAMDAVFPMAFTESEFWQNCLASKDVITEIPHSRFDINQFYDPYPLAPGKTNSRFGGFLNMDFDFPAEKFGLKPRALEWLDPQQKLVLMQCDRLLQPFSQHAFMQKGSSEKMGLYCGVGFPDYLIQSIKNIPVEKVNAYSGIGMADFSTVGRISYHYGFEGPAMLIKTACSSSLVAVHQAVRALQCGDCDVAIAGGVNLILIPEIHVCLTKGGFLSPEGRCKAFDAAANGYVRSEGSGFVLLKRYEDAITAGDCILATIIGSAVNQDGATNGFTAPSGDAQIKCYQSALNNAGIHPHDVTYIESHGTGTQLGDAIEMQSIQSVYDINRSNPLYVGAVKSSIGHCESAAGIAGLIKTIGVLTHQVIPPNLHYNNPNPAISFENSAIVLPTAKIVLKKPCRYAAVSSFGVTGTNAHVIVGNMG